MRRYHHYLAALVVLAVSTDAWAEDAYPIKLHRASKVGDVYDTTVSSEQTQSTVTTIGDAAPRTQSGSIKTELKGRVTVVEVNDKGDAKTLTLKVEKLTDGDGKALLEKDKVIDIKREGKSSTFTMQGGGDLPLQTHAVLNLMFPAIKDTDEDEIFGSKTPRKVGESWPIDSEKAAKSAAKDGLKLEAKDVSGKTTLQKVEDVKDIGKALRIDATMDVKNITPPVPPGATLEKCDMKSSLTGLYPVDTSLHAVESAVSMEMNMTFTGSGAKVDAKVQMKLKGTETPVKP